LKPRWPLPEAVDGLANHTAGGQVQFRTDSKRLAIRVQLAGRADMNHMPATGQCGFDCYIGEPTRQLYRSSSKYDIARTDYELEMYNFPTSTMHTVTLNFPLYQGVKEVLIGLEPDAGVQPPPPYADDRPIVVYGTSITQGGCASRPGMAYTNILSRKLDRPFVNLGFSGSGRGEPEVAHTIAAMPPTPACFVLDYEANASANQQLQRTLGGFIDILREKHPETPILIVSRIRFAGENFSESEARGRLERLDFQRRTVEAKRADGDGNIHFLDGSDLLGEDFEECTVDGVHPTDLGFWRLAEGLLPAVTAVLDAR
jgi:hypothetical protein